MKLSAVIVAAGRGTRASTDHSGPAAQSPKQYAVVNGQALLSHTIRAMASHPVIESILVVIHPDDREHYDQMLMRDGGPDVLCDPALGGATRQDSVLAGLQHLARQPNVPTHVLIHDAARPFVPLDVLDRVISQMTSGSAALAALPVIDTLQQTNNNCTVVASVSRDNIWRAQTPQGFAFAEILSAHEKAAKAGKADFTDDVSLFRWAGGSVQVVLGSQDNQKITTAEDLALAQTTSSLYSNSPAHIRTGIGYDVHKVGPGDHVMLCGIKVPADFSLIGHSDADVALHALTDAIFGALGDGDIGSHFPPSDPQWKGVASEVFLARAAQCVAERGGRLNNVDVTIICESPRIGPVREDMRREIARILDIPIARVSVKATTSEGLGFTGRAEGIAAMASATLSLPEH